MSCSLFDTAAAASDLAIADAAEEPLLEELEEELEALGNREDRAELAGAAEEEVLLAEEPLDAGAAPPPAATVPEMLAVTTPRKSADKVKQIRHTKLTNKETLLM